VLQLFRKTFDLAAAVADLSLLDGDVVSDIVRIVLTPQLDEMIFGGRFHLLEVPHALACRPL